MAGRGYSRTEVLSRCLESIYRKDDLLKDNYISLQKTKLQNQQQHIKVQNKTVGQFQSTLETELKSYRDVVASSSTKLETELKRRCCGFKQNRCSSLAQRIVDVVKEAVKTEDRSKNVILYDVSEDDSTDFEKSVCEVFSSIGEKPQLGYCMRLGSKSGAKL